MELKCPRCWASVAAIIGFNRTFMELKLRVEREHTRWGLRFNRTFMELKLRQAWTVRSVSMEF